MGRKTRLERAVEAQADSLNEAQRAIVLSQFRDYKRNRARIAAIEVALSAGHPNPPAGSDEMKAQLAQRMTLSNERAALISANNQIAATLFEQLADKE